jgi:FKBP-type peptidyl-prolyl cis-trans isomerase (trigger factor)
MSGQTIDDVREDMREPAENRLKRSLVLQQFVKQEQIEVSDSEVEETLDRRVAGRDDTTREALRRILGEGRGRELIISGLLIDKASQRIEAIYTGQSPELAGEPSAEAADAAGDEEE